MAMRRFTLVFIGFLLQALTVQQLPVCLAASAGDDKDARVDVALYTHNDTHKILHMEGDATSWHHIDVPVENGMVNMLPKHTPRFDTRHPGEETSEALGDRPDVGSTPRTDTVSEPAAEKVPPQGAEQGVQSPSTTESSPSSTSSQNNVASSPASLPQAETPPETVPASNISKLAVEEELAAEVKTVEAYMESKHHPVSNMSKTMLVDREKQLAGIVKTIASSIPGLTNDTTEDSSSEEEENETVGRDQSDPAVRKELVNGTDVVLTAEDPQADGKGHEWKVTTFTVVMCSLVGAVFVLMVAVWVRRIRRYENRQLLEEDDEEFTVFNIVDHHYPARKPENYTPLE